MSGLALATVSPTGRDRVARWLADPAVAGWWGGRAAAEARIAIAMSTSGAICRMIDLEGEAIGYAQALDAGLSADAGGMGLKAGVAECMVFIGEAQWRGRGLWPAALDLLAREVLSTTLAIACAVAVPVRDEKVARAAERVGFKWQRIEDDPATGPTWVMVRERGR